MKGVSNNNPTRVIDNSSLSVDSGRRHGFSRDGIFGSRSVN